LGFVIIRFRMDDQSKLKEVNGALERVVKKQRICYTKTLGQLDQLLCELNKCKEQLNPDKMDTDSNKSISDSIKELNTKIQESNISTIISAEHREYYATISKFGKTIDKNFHADIHLVMIQNGIHFDTKILNQIIAQHFFREARFEIGDIFVKETNIDYSASMKAPFLEMHTILDAIVNQKNLTPAIEWATRQRDELISRGNMLEFQLHRLQFIYLLTNCKRDDAILYARKNFPIFSSTEMKEIQKLMGSLLYYRRLEKSPYAHYLQPQLWLDIAHDFTSACCTLLGLSTESPLYTSVSAGSIALPKQMKMTSILQGKGIKLQPIEHELGKDFQFHPIFACPVSKEQTTSENPPMLLICGHMIAKASMLKLARSGTRFKCPYCPAEQSTTRARPVIF